jgi:hypothetical protein
MTTLRWVVVASAFFALLGTSVFRNASAAPAGVYASFDIAKARFLSTDEPTGRLVLKNGLTQTLFFNPTSVRFLIRHSGGSVETKPWITMITHIIPSTAVAPGSTYEVDVPLPKCDVDSDPCSQQVSVACLLSNPHAAYELTSNTVAYEFIPDPEATFAVMGLGRDRPLLMAQGDGSGTLVANARALSFSIYRYPNAPLRTLSKRILEIFDRHKIHAQVTGGAFPLFVIDRYSSQNADVDAAKTDIEQTLGLKTADDCMILGDVNQPDAFDFFQDARANAIGELNTLSVITHTDPYGEIHRWFGAYDSGRVAPQSENWIVVNPAGTLQYTPDRPMQSCRELPATPPPAQVRKRITEVATGGSTGSLPQVRIPGADFYYGAAIRDLTGFVTQARIGADRTQLYEIASLRERDALRHGLHPYAAAIALAKRRADDFAALLGVRTSIPTMFALYPTVDDGLGRITSIGLAVASDNENVATWRQFRSKHAVMPAPSASPAPLIPIYVWDSKTTVIGRGYATAGIKPNLVRLDVAVNGGLGAPSPGALLSQIRKAPDIKSVALQLRSGESTLPAGYELLVRSPSAERLNSLVGMIREYYSGANPSIGAAATTAIAGCAHLERTLEKKAAAEATLDALHAAQTTHQRLQKLVLAALYPLATGEAACSDEAEEHGLDRAADPGQPLKIPAATSATSVVDLTFRTWR